MHRMAFEITETNRAHTKLKVWDNGALAGELTLSKDGLIRLACRLTLPDLIKDEVGIKGEWNVELGEKPVD